MAGRSSAGLRRREGRWHGDLKADDLFFVDISRKFDEGAGIVKTSDEPFLVSAQASCTP